VELEQLAERYESGPDGHTWLGALNDLGLCYMAEGRFDEAERLFQKSLEANLRAGGPDHRATMICYSSLGLLALRRERWDEAIDWLGRSFRGTIRLFGDEQLDVRRAADYLILLVPRAEDLGAAEATLRELFAWQRRTGAPADALGRTKRWLGSALIENDRCAEAEPLLVESIETLTEVFGELHPKVAASVGAYARALLCLGRLDEAEPLLEAAWEDLGDTDPRERRAVARALATLCTERGDTTDAAVWRARGA
jgi:tetratricopeptide (TPR) repeat protein